jgi:hypothetical protein
MKKLTVPGILSLTVLSASGAFAGFEGAPKGPFTGNPVFGPDTLSALLRVEYGVDTNVQLAPDKTFFQNPPGTRQDTESDFARLIFDGHYLHSLSATRSVGLALTGSAQFYLDTIPGSPPGIGTYHDYNTFILNPTLFYNVALEGVDVQAYYQFRWEQGIDVAAIGLEGHTVGFALSHDVSPEWRIRGGASASFNDYNVEFPNMVLNDRDATHTRIDAGADYFIQGGRAIVSATAHYAINDSEGLNWGYDAWGVELGVKGAIVPRVFGSVKTGYQHRDYGAGFQSPFVTAPGRTEQDIVTAEARLSYQIDRRFSVDAFVQHADYSANDNPGGGVPPDSAFFEGDKTVFGVGVNVKLY